MKKYEVILILNDQKFDDAGAAFVKQVEEYIDSIDGKVVETESMGQRQLAHSIGRRNTGVYWSLVFELPEANVADLKEHYRLEDAVLRLEVFVYDRPEKVSTKADEEESED